MKTAIFKSQKGVILVIALVFMLSLTLMGITLLFSTKIQTYISTNTFLHKKALYIADSGYDLSCLLIKEAFEKRVLDSFFDNLFKKDCTVVSVNKYLLNKLMNLPKSTQEEDSPTTSADVVVFLNRLLMELDLNLPSI